MATNRNVKVFEVNVGGVVGGIFAGIARTASIRNQSVMAAQMREALRQTLIEVVQGAYRDGSAPVRTGKSRNIMLRGVRVYGSSFANLRGHIIGPDYIRTQEDGAVIRPVNAKALTIPLAAALRPDGTPKLPGPRSWQNILPTFIFKSKKTDNSYIAYKNPGGGLTLLYVLVDEVTITKRGFLAKNWNQRKPLLMERIGIIMLEEFAKIDLMQLARIKVRGRR
jgi:hypothetical protein